MKPYKQPSVNTRRTRGTNATKVSQAEAVSEMGATDKIKADPESFHRVIEAKKKKAKK